MSASIETPAYKVTCDCHGCNRCLRRTEDTLALYRRAFSPQQYEYLVAAMADKPCARHRYVCDAGDLTGWTINGEVYRPDDYFYPTQFDAATGEPVGDVMYCPECSTMKRGKRA